MRISAVGVRNRISTIQPQVAGIQLEPTYTSIRWILALIALYWIWKSIPSKKVLR